MPGCTEIHPFKFFSFLLTTPSAEKSMNPGNIRKSLQKINKKSYEIILKDFLKTIEYVSNIHVHCISNSSTIHKLYIIY